ncbi:MAG: hypothetical protein KAG66_03475 [Methylococcales bacterium]|nr:hypothetical protein [Methylococcales bacterium]
MTELEFTRSAGDLLLAKTGILLASVVAGVSGFLWLYFTYKKTED